MQSDRAARPGGLEQGPRPVEIRRIKLDLHPFALGKPQVIARLLVHGGEQIFGRPHEVRDQRVRRLDVDRLASAPVGRLLCRFYPDEDLTHTLSFVKRGVAPYWPFRAVQVLHPERERHLDELPCPHLEVAATDDPTTKRFLEHPPFPR